MSTIPELTEAERDQLLADRPEWELTRAVLFSAAEGADTVLIEPRWIEVKRFFRVDRDNIVGSNEEQRLVEQELTRDLVDQVLRSVNQVLGERAASGAG